MKALGVVDGDLALSGRDYFLVSGAARIRQDLTIALNDPYGSDRMHPYWGSILEQFIGQPITGELQQRISDEIRRVVQNYIAVQADAINTNIAFNLIGTYDTSDVVDKIENISVQVNFDSINLTVALSTLSRQTVTITRQVTA